MSELSNDETALAIIEEEADRTIRRTMQDGRMFFSAIDVIVVLTDSPRPRKYWHNLKTIMQEKEGWHELSPIRGQLKTQATDGNGGFLEVYEKIVQLKMLAPDGKQRATDAADTETLLRIIQSIPSPKAEPVKQWLARIGAKQLDEITRPLESGEAKTERMAITKPTPDAPALAWAEYHEQLAVLYRRQAAYEARLLYVDARLEEHDEQLARHESRFESLEEQVRLLPEILERLGPQTLTPEHLATIKNAVRHLSELTGAHFQTIYADLNESFHVAKYDQIAEFRWLEVSAWLKTRLDAAEKRRKH